MTKVDFVRFAQDYNHLNQQEKTRWLNDAYAAEFPDLFEGIADREAVFREQKANIVTWRRQIGRETTARNRLYELFLNVRPRDPPSTFSLNPFTSSVPLSSSTPSGLPNSYAITLPPTFTRHWRFSPRSYSINTKKKIIRYLYCSRLSSTLSYPLWRLWQVKKQHFISTDSWKTLSTNFACPVCPSISR